MQSEAALYSALRRCVPGYVSVGHRASLFEFHTHVLAYNERAARDGGVQGWHMMPVSEYLASQR